ncbi:MAG: hypothetical protein AUG49_25565, partial [Catenulispora sp. 13_1_20CM_3_70_7]
VDNCTPESRVVLQAAAVMGEQASTARIAALTGLDWGTIAACGYFLTAAGLLADDGKCPPPVASAVIDDMSAPQRRDAHRRFAELLFEENAGATTVAQQLIAAGDPAPAWAVEVLRTAAEEQSATDLQAALRFVRAARRLAVDEADRAALTMKLASLSWRADPAAVRRYAPELVQLLRTGRLAPDEAELAIRYLLWFGRIDDAVEALDRLLAATEPQVPGLAVRLRPFILWTSIWYPDVIERVPAARDLRHDKALRIEAVGARSVEAGNTFELLLHSGEQHEIAAEAQRLLESCVLDDRTLDWLLTALLALLHADEVECAARWCKNLLAQAWARRAGSWLAQLTAVRAQIALRTGRLKPASVYATRALAWLPAEKWGVRVGLPLATLAQARTLLGDYDRAAGILDGPVPPEMLDTTFGMFYLQARGQLLLAVGSLPRARVEFESCLEFMRQREVELPNLLPWRVHLAEVHSRLGQVEQARILAEEQLALNAAHGGHWARGIALRLLARTAEPDEARDLLKSSVGELRASGAKLDLAAALTDLSRAHREAGEAAKAEQLERHAQQLTATCGKTWDRADADACPTAVQDNLVHLKPKGHGRQRLSMAEQRVAILAANGRTNTEIARELFVTPSTVEQHLTRIYRKLEIHGRSELVSIGDLALAV